MKIKLFGFSLLVVLLFGVTACGTSSDSGTTSQEEETEETTLEATELSVFASYEKQYYGECVFSDNSSTPIMIDVDDPYNDIVIFIHYINARQEKIVFNAPSSNGDVYYIEEDAGGTLIPDSTWDFILSDDRQYYTGTINEGTLFECNLSVGLDVQTIDELYSLVSEINDQVAPVITLNGDSNIKLTIGDTYNEPGATASDNKDGDISANIVITGAVDGNTPGQYILSYDVNDAAGNVAQTIIRTVTVASNVDPVASDDNAITTKDSAVTLDVLANDSDADGDSLNITSYTQGVDGSVTQSGLSLIYTPTSNFSDTDSFTYSISDGNGGTDSATVIVTLTDGETPIFSEDWETGIDNSKWKIWGSPSPTVIAGEGRNGSQALDPQGDANWASGVTSYQNFNLSSLPKLEFWALGNSTQLYWQNLRVGFSTETADGYIGTGNQPGFAGGWIYLGIDDSKEFIRYQVGAEYFDETWIDAEHNSLWMKYSIVTNPDGTYSFYRDEQLRWTSTASITLTDYTEQALVIQGRSDNALQLVDDINVTVDFSDAVSIDPPTSGYYFEASIQVNNVTDLASAATALSATSVDNYIHWTKPIADYQFSSTRSSDGPYGQLPSDVSINFYLQNNGLLTIRATSESQTSLLTLLTSNAMSYSCGTDWVGDYHDYIAAYNLLTAEELLGLHLGNFSSVVADGLCQLADNTIGNLINLAEYTTRFDATTVHHNFDKPLFLIRSHIYHQQADYSWYDETTRYIHEFVNGLGSIQVDQLWDGNFSGGRGAEFAYTAPLYSAVSLYLASDNSNASSIWINGTKEIDRTICCSSSEYHLDIFPQSMEMQVSSVWSSVRPSYGMAILADNVEITNWWEERDGVANPGDSWSQNPKPIFIKIDGN